MNNEEMTEIGKHVAKQKRPKRSEQMVVQTNPGDNSRFLEHNLKLMGLPPVDTSNRVAIENRIVEYFNICYNNDMKPSVAGLALAFNVDRTTIWRWANETNENDPRNSIKKAYVLLDAQMVDYMQNGKINPISGIFLMRNNFGYRNEQEVVITTNNPLGEQKDADEIRQRYIEGTVIDE